MPIVKDHWLLSRLSRETSSGRFIPEMDGLRFVAIGMVILFHLTGYLLAKAPPSTAPSTQSIWLAQIAQAGIRGVELFFVISGFILALPFAAYHLKDGVRVDLRKYYLRRLTRLEPPYLVTLLLLFVLALLIQGKTVADLFPHVLASFFYLHNLIFGSPSPAMGVAWSLEIEVQFYVLMPLLAFVFGIKTRWLRRLTLVASIFATLTAQSLLLPTTGAASLSILAYSQFFLTGFLLADVYLVDAAVASRWGTYWDAVSLAGWPLLFFMPANALAQWLLPLAIFLLYCAAFRGTRCRNILSYPAITAVGGMCYSIYLIHYEVISATGRFTKGVGFGLPFGAYLLIQLVLIGASILSICGLYFVLLEKPCMRPDWPVRAWSHLQDRVLSRTRTAQTAAAD